MMRHHKTRVRILAWILILGLVACTRSWQDSIDRGQSLEANKRYTEAITVYQQAINDHPDHADVTKAYLKIAQIYHVGLQDRPRALQAYQKLIETHPGTPASQEAFRQQAEILIEQEEWSDAIATYTLLMNKEPKAVSADEIQYRIGWLHMKRGDDQQALFELNQFLEKFSESPWRDDVHYRLAEIHFKMHEFETALRHYKQVAETFSDSPHALQAQYNAGLCLEHLGEWDEALAIYDSLKKIYPNRDMLERQIEQLRRRREEAGRG